MRESDLMLNSSLFEGLPIALSEAAMSALPVVATDVGGSGEIVPPDVNGLLVPPGDPKAMARAILAILLDEDRYAAMSKASAERSRQSEERRIGNECASTVRTRCAAEHQKKTTETERNA